MNVMRCVTSALEPTIAAMKPLEGSFALHM